MLHGKLLDISRGGARLSGICPARLRRGDMISPCSFSLPLSSGPGRVAAFTVAEAKVAWSAAKAGGVLEMGISFQAGVEETAKIAAYAQARNLAAEVGSGEPEPVDERRRSERLAPVAPSRLLFLMPGGNRVVMATPSDISLAGAGLNGNFSSKLASGLVIGPLTFTLYRRFAPNEPVDLTIPEATVVWTAGKEAVESFGVRFDPGSRAAADLDDYLRCRRLEMQAEQRRGKA